MNAEQRRQDYRIAVPPGAVRELALWFRAEAPLLRLTLAELGWPDLILSRLGTGSLTLADLSIRGMGLTVRLPQIVIDKLKEATTILAYLQLFDPASEDRDGFLNVFVQCALTRDVPQDDGHFLGMRFARFAVASMHEKSLEFLDAARHGVVDLAKWCDNVARGLTFEARQQGDGLDMDDLFGELERAAANAPDADRVRHEEQT